MVKRRSDKEPGRRLKLVPPLEESEFPPHDEPFDPRASVAAVVAGFAAVDDPIEAELAVAMFLAGLEFLGDAFEAAIREHFLPAIESVAESAGASFLTVLGVLAGPPIDSAAADVVARLRARGIVAHSWVEELLSPIIANNCVALVDDDDEPYILAAGFRRAGAAHGMMILLDPEDCGAVHDIMLLPEDEVSPSLAMIREAGLDGRAFVEKALDPAEFRWYAEVAMAIRADHDEELGLDELLNEIHIDEQEGPPFRVMAPLLRSRLGALPKSDRPVVVQHGGADLSDLMVAMRRFGPRSSSGLGFPLPKLPSKRKTGDGVAPTLRMRVDLNGAKPPIWRRLEVPADMPLARLHEVLQIAFDWHDSHLHSFETDYGLFGEPDRELGQRSEKSVTVEQVASLPGEKFTYTYDFGDSWEHRIVIEKIVEPEVSAHYPRCTGGRRAAPPEDCGGIWGYQDMLETLADPDHDEHDSLLDWLGIDHAEELDPARFDMRGINDSLARIRLPKRKFTTNTR